MSVWQVSRAGQFERKRNFFRKNAQKAYKKSEENINVVKGYGIQNFKKCNRKHSCY